MIIIKNRDWRKPLPRGRRVTPAIGFWSFNYKFWCLVGWNTWASYRQSPPPFLLLCVYHHVSTYRCWSDTAGTHNHCRASLGAHLLIHASVDRPTPPASTPLSIVTFFVAFYGHAENLTHTVDVHATQCQDSREVWIPRTTSLLEVAAISTIYNIL